MISISISARGRYAAVRLNGLVRAGFWIGAVIGLLAVPATAAERSSTVKVSEPQMQAMGITVLLLQAGDAGVQARFPAQVVVPPGGERLISTPVAALIEQVFVQPGQAVRAGAPLIRVASAELGQLQMQLLQAVSRAQLARQVLAREQALFSEGIVPERRVQEARAEAQQAEASVQQARAALRLSGMPGPAVDRVATSGQVQDSLTVTAPEASTVAEVSVRAGQRVEASSPLLHLVRAGALGLDIQVPASEAVAYPLGASVSLVGRDATARIVSVSPVVATGSQTTTLRAAVNGVASAGGVAGVGGGAAAAARALQPGEVVTVLMSASSAAMEGWTVPLPAVVYDGQKAHVFVKTVQGFEARPVQVLSSAGQQVRIRGALKSGEAIAVSGVIALKGAWMKEAP